MNELTKWLDQYMDELTPKQFYRMIFPEGELDDRGSMTKGKYTGIIIEVTNKKRKVQKKYKDGSVKESIGIHLRIAWKRLIKSWRAETSVLRHLFLMPERLGVLIMLDFCMR